MLRHVVAFEDPAVLVDARTADDAAVYRLDAERALVATTDFFTPIVDDPFDFGRIAAANALSDVYAMGARPLFALNLVAFPRRLLGQGVLEEILRGGSTVAREAGIAIVGGHSIDDSEPKYGLCVVGEVARQLAYRASARAYIEGRVDRVGNGFFVLLRMLDAETGALRFSISDLAEDRDRLIPALDRLSRRLRQAPAPSPAGGGGSSPGRPRRSRCTGRSGSRARRR